MILATSNTTSFDSNDGIIRLWNVDVGVPQNSFDTEAAASLAFSPDGTILASGNAYGKIKLWDSINGKLLATLEGHENLVLSVAFSPDGTILASASGDQTVRLWDVASGTLLATLEGHTAWAETVAFRSDGTILATGSDDRTIRLWGISSNS